MIEDDIIEGELDEGDQIPSTTEISKFYQVNRATAQKGLAVLVDEGYAYKRAGRYICRWRRHCQTDWKRNQNSPGLLNCCLRNLKTLYDNR